VDIAYCSIIESGIFVPEVGPFIAYDIGANVGFFSIYVATVSENQSKIYSFEPNPVAYPEMQANIKSEGLTENVQIFNVFLSSENRDDVEIYTPKTDTHDLSRLKNIHPLLSPGEWISHKISIINLDDFDITDPHFIKIDVEDHKFEALLGAEQKITRSKPIIHFENWCYSFCYMRSFRVFSLLESFGYAFFSPVWRIVDGCDERWSEFEPKYGDDLSKVRIYLNPINIETRITYTQNVNVLAIHRDSIDVVMRRLHRWNES
jgi:FkbM family methyltransferase